METVDVAIVGGGPGGLAAAAALHAAFDGHVKVKVWRSSLVCRRRQLRLLSWTHAFSACTLPRVPNTPHIQKRCMVPVIILDCLQVYESLREYKVQGSGVLFNANGQSAVEAINPDLLQRYLCKNMFVGKSMQLLVHCALVPLCFGESICVMWESLTAVHKATLFGMATYTV